MMVDSTGMFDDSEEERVWDNLLRGVPFLGAGWELDFEG